jgi:hypothetical protein
MERIITLVKGGKMKLFFLTLMFLSPFAFGIIPTNNGGTGINASGVTNGQLLIGQSSDHSFGLATLTGTSNQVIVTNSGHSITLSAPQNLGTASSPQFAAIGLGQSVPAVTGLVFAATSNAANDTTTNSATLAVNYTDQTGGSQSDRHSGLVLTVTPTITSGTTNTDRVVVIDAENLRSGSGDQGTLSGINNSLTTPSGLIGQRIAYGHLSTVNSSASTAAAIGLLINPYHGAGTITSSYGIYLQSVAATGATVTNYYGVYSPDSTALHYFNGKVGFGTSSPGRAIEVNSGAASTPAIKFTSGNGTVSNGSVASTFTANSGPTGAATSIQGWVPIDVGGTIRYIPFF